MKLTSVAAARLAGLFLLVLAGCVVIPARPGRRSRQARGNGQRARRQDRSRRPVQPRRPHLRRRRARAGRPAGRVDPSSVRVSLNGTDITSAFAVRPNGAYEGVVTGLANGDNDLMATMKNGPTVHLTDHEPPERRPGLRRAAGAAVGLQDGHRLPGADGRAMRRRADLLVLVHGRRRRTRSSRTTRRRRRRPSIATTTTDQGVTVPYIVRSEQARWTAASTTSACSRIPPASWAPWASQRGWNHKVLYQFGGGTAPWHTNGAPSERPRSTSRSRAGSWSRTTT